MAGEGIVEGRKNPLPGQSPGRPQGVAVPLIVRRAAEATDGLGFKPRTILVEIRFCHEICRVYGMAPSERHRATPTCTALDRTAVDWHTDGSWKVLSFNPNVEEEERAGLEAHRHSSRATDQ